MTTNKEKAEIYKTKGNDAFSKENFIESMDFFTEAIHLDPTNHIYYSNRSGARAALHSYEDALKDAIKCIELKPDWPKGYQRKGLAEFFLKKFDDAILTYNEGLKVDPNNQQLKEGLEKAQESKDSTENLTEQQKDMLKKLTENPKTKEFLQDPDFVAKLQLLQKNPQLIMQFMNDPKMKTALSVMFGLPEDLDFSNLKKPQGQHEHTGDCCHHEHEDEHEHEHEHKEEDKKEEEDKPTSQQKTENKKQYSGEKKMVDEAEEAKLEGNTLYQQKKFDEALKKYDRAIELKPHEILYYSNKAAVYTTLEQFDKAHEIIDEAIKIMDEQKINDFNKRAKVYARKAAIFKVQKKYTESLEFYQKSTLEDNDYKIKQEMKKVQELKVKFDKESYLNPEKAEEANEKGREFFLLGEYSKALEQYEEGIKRNPNSAKLYMNKATCLIKMIKWSNALDDINKSLELDPKYEKAWAKKGSIHFAIKEYHKAIDAYKKGLEINPNNEECKEGLVKVNTKMYLQPESKEEAEQRARNAMTDPEIQSILTDPQVMNILRNMTENPHSDDARKALNDPVIAGKIQKLILAGIVKTS